MQKRSQIDSLRPSSETAPSIWYAAVAAPHRNSLLNFKANVSRAPPRGARPMRRAFISTDEIYIDRGKSKQEQKHLQRGISDDSSASVERCSAARQAKKGSK